MQISERQSAGAHTARGGKAESEEEIIRKILSLERKAAEYKRKNRLEWYNKGRRVHLKQLEFHKCLKRNRWVFGGNRTGKTECGAVEAVWLARGIHPYRANRSDVRGWIVSVSREVQREVAQSKILDYVNPDWIEDIVMSAGRASNPRAGIIDTITIKNVLGGSSVITFKSCEMGREKFQGASLDFVWFDEEPPEDVYNECRMRVMDRKGEIFGTMTPLKGLTFAYYKIFLNEDGDSEMWHETMEWRDNPFLDEKEIERVSAALDPSALESRRYGRFSAECGPVYPEFDERVHVIKPFDVPFLWQDKLSIDPGLNNPLSCHWYCVDGDGNIYVVAEHYAAGKDIAWHSRRICEQCGQLGWHTGFGGRYDALIDAAATQRTLASARPVTELFYERGINCNAKVDKQLFAGISRVKQYLAGDGPKLYIFDSCVNMIREFKSYWWGNGDVPRKKDDHAMDELRYYVMSRPEPNVPRRETDELTRFKEKLIRRRARRA